LSVDSTVTWLAGRDGGVQHILGASTLSAPPRRGGIRRTAPASRLRVEHQVGLDHGLGQAVVVAHVADDKAQPRVGQGVAKVVLLLLVAAEDADFGCVPARARRTTASPNDRSRRSPGGFLSLTCPALRGRDAVWEERAFPLSNA